MAEITKEYKVIDDDTVDIIYTKRVLRGDIQAKIDSVLTKRDAEINKITDEYAEVIKKISAELDQFSTIEKEKL